MTIHKAKGLEFDVVILPGLHKASRRNDKPLVSLQTFKLTNGEDAVLMAPVPPKGQQAPSVYQYLYAVDAERASFETQRLLYVAATRAKHQLHLLGRIKRNKDGSISAPKGTFLNMLLPLLWMPSAAWKHFLHWRRKKNHKLLNSYLQALPLLRLANEPLIPIRPAEHPRRSTRRIATVTLPRSNSPGRCRALLAGADS